MRTLVAHVSLALGTLLHSIKDNRRVDGEEGSWPDWPGKPTLAAPPEILILSCFTPKKHAPNSGCPSMVFPKYREAA